MPEATVKPRAEVINELKRFGVEVEVKEQYALDKPTGSVLDTTPAAGEPLPAVVQLTVAQPGAAIFLTQLCPADGSCSRGEADMNGTHYANSLNCYSGDPEPRATVCLLNRLTKQIVGDGKVLDTATVSYANPATVSFDTTGVLRLEVQVTSPTRSPAVLGDVLIRGAVDEMARLGDDSGDASLPSYCSWDRGVADRDGGTSAGGQHRYCPPARWWWSSTPPVR